MRRRAGALAAALMLFLQILPALAVTPDEVLADPALEARARDISAELRCLVCQNQSIDDSNAELARDLRLLVRDRLKSGDTNAEVIDYVVSRYGEFVLLKPRLSLRTIALWSTPAIVFVLGAAIMALNARGRTKSRGEKALTAEEEAEIARLVEDGRKDG